MPPYAAIGTRPPTEPHVPSDHLHDHYIVCLPSAPPTLFVVAHEQPPTTIPPEFRQQRGSLLDPCTTAFNRALSLSRPNLQAFGVDSPQARASAVRLLQVYEAQQGGREEEAAELRADPQVSHFLKYV